MHSAQLGGSPCRLVREVVWVVHPPWTCSPCPLTELWKLVLGSQFFTDIWVFLRYPRWPESIECISSCTGIGHIYGYFHFIRNHCVLIPWEASVFLAFGVLFLVFIVRYDWEKTLPSCMRQTGGEPHVFSFIPVLDLALVPNQKHLRWY